MKKNIINIILILLIIVVIGIFGFNIYLVISQYLDNSATPEDELTEKTVEVLSNEDEIIGYLRIESIGLYAPIKDGTDNATLKEAIGHFTDTAYLSGNVCLAAHNRRI